MIEEFTDDDIDMLDTFLMSDDMCDDGMTLPIMDGFLTAIAIGPEIVMPGEWLPKIWGSEPPEWKSELHAELIISTIMARYNEILRSVIQGEEHYGLILSDFEDMHMACEEWTWGFMQGVELRQKAWEPLFQSEANRLLIEPITVQQMSKKEVLEADAAHGNNRLHEIWKNGADLIPKAVVEIDRFWKQARGYYDGNKQKTGRNACPCGSGRKYKKCCGSN